MINFTGKCVFCKYVFPSLAVAGCCEDCYNERLPELQRRWAWWPELPARVDPDIAPALLLPKRKKTLSPSTNSPDDYPVGTGYVYLLRTMDDPVEYKIGMTSVSVRSRRSSVSVDVKRDLAEIHRIRCDNPRNIEHGLHKRFKDKRIHGEWFSLSPEDVAYIKSLTYFGEREGLKAA